MDVIGMLKKDHQTITKLFQRFKSRPDARNRSSVVEKVCNELDVHTRLEEELFYPAVEACGDPDLARMVGQARQDHERARQQIRTLRRMMKDGGDGLEAAVSTLEQDIEHHVTEEEGEMFPRVEEVMDGARRREMARRVQARRRELAGEMGDGRAAAGAVRGRRAGGRAARAAQGGQQRAGSSRRKRTKGAKSPKARRGRGRAKKRARGGGR